MDIRREVQWTAVAALTLGSGDCYDAEQPR
jgi:hypothetical protein